MKLLLLSCSVHLIAALCQKSAAAAAAARDSELAASRVRIGLLFVWDMAFGAARWQVAQGLLREAARDTRMYGRALERTIQAASHIIVFSIVSGPAGWLAVYDGRALFGRSKRGPETREDNELDH